jgi:hypothetical protein
MVISIIGNGPSNKAYVSQGGYVVACNVPQHGHKYDALSIIDNQPINWMRNNSWNPRRPVFCTQTVKDYAFKKNISGDFHPVYNKIERYNAGLHAARYNAQLTKEIHLWGFDSLYSDVLESQMDTLVPRHSRPPLNKWWRPHWQELFDEFQQIEFVVHMPNGRQLDFEKPNVIPHYFEI